MRQEIILRYIEGVATAEEIEAVVHWIDADDAHLQGYLLLRKTYEATIWNYTPKQRNFFPNQTKERFKSILKIAAVFVLGLFSFYLYHQYSTSTNPINRLSTSNIIVPEGQRVNVELNDGSNVWVNAKSKLSIVENGFNNREVYLEGEAHFDIAHDPNRKFIVKTKDYQMMVKGTEFNVKALAESNYFEVGLVHGSVEVSSLNNDQTILLKPSERVYAEAGGLLNKGVIDKEEFAWIDGILCFSELSVDQIFEKIEQYYDVDIEVLNQNILNKKFTGKFWINDGVEQVLEVLQLNNSFKYKRVEENGNLKFIIY